MGGSTPFREALQARLDLIKPSRDDIAACLAAHPPQLSPGVADLISGLHARGTDVYLVSGGFRLVRSCVCLPPLHHKGNKTKKRQKAYASTLPHTKMINPVADMLSIPHDRVYANTILFSDDGKYAGFDASEPTSEDGGKPAVIASLKASHNYSPVVMVGDGATDLQARPPADAFIGFGGIAVREVVEQGSDWFVKDFGECVDVVKANSKL